MAPTRLHVGDTDEALKRVEAADEKLIYKTELEVNILKVLQ